LRHPAPAACGPATARPRRAVVSTAPEMNPVPETMPGPFEGTSTPAHRSGPLEQFGTAWHRRTGSDLRRAIRWPCGPVAEALPGRYERLNSSPRVGGYRKDPLHAGHVPLVVAHRDDELAPLQIRER